MKNLLLKDLIDIVASEAQVPEARLEKIYDWVIQRNLEISKWLLGLTATVAATFLITLFKEELKSPFWLNIIIFIAMLLSGSYGFLRLYRYRQIQREYIAALKLHNDLKRISSFIQKYRNEVVK